MKNLHCLALALVLSAAVAGCTQQPAVTSISSSPMASATPKDFDGSILPDRVEGIRGVPLLSESPALDGALKGTAPQPGAYFLLLSKDITKAVLVYAGPNLKPEDLALKKSEKMVIKGPVKKFSNADFKKFVKAKYQVDLAGAGDDVQVIMAEGDLFPAPATPSATPGAPTASPTSAK